MNNIAVTRQATVDRQLARIEELEEMLGQQVVTLKSYGFVNHQRMKLEKIDHVSSFNACTLIKY